MSFTTPRSRAARRTGAGFVLALLALALVPFRAAAQCTVSGAAVPFEPNPPGATRPGSLSSGFSNSLALYKNAAGSQRLLMIEAWGYSTLDLTNPGSPSALKYDDMRLDPNNETTNQIRANGDGQNYIQTIGVSPDGQRVAFSVTGPAEPNWHNLVGRTDGAEGFGMWGDYGLSRAVSTAVQQVNSRYISYALYTSQNVIASDVTTLPTLNGDFQSLNLASETTAFPPGVSLSVAGNYLVYLLLGGGVEVVDASAPGPVGNITGGYKTIQITSVPGDPFSRKPTNYTAAVDPSDPTKLWVLVELAASTANGENSPSYGLVSISNSGGVLQAPVSAGPLFRVPSQAGETWGTAGNSASLVASNGQLFALMWAVRFLPSQQFWVYSTTASAGGWSAPVASQMTTPGFGLAPTSASALSGTGTAVFQYIPTGSRAFVVPFACQPVNAPASSSLLVTNASTGAAVQSGATVFAGDTLAVAPTIVPSPAAKPLASWSFDYDFHAGNAIEDAGTTPRVKNSDLNQANAGASPPPTILYTGPCDPKAGGDPINNPTGCWASVIGNGASGGPDFATSDAAGTTKPLAIALEATNQFGISNTAVFTVNWRLPAARAASTQILSGQALTSGSDGHPTATGFKWYFGASPTSLSLAAGCNGPTCLGPFNTKGTYYYWLTATYPNGYVTPDYDGVTNIGQAYSVTDFAPAFTVGGSATGPITAVLSQNIQIVNSSQHGAGVTGQYFYSVCQIVSGGTCAAGSWLPLTGMTDPPTSGSPPTSATISASSTAGSFLLRIAVNYPGGQALWPDATGTNGFPINVTSAVPKIRIYVNGQDPCPPGPFCIENSVNAHVGDTLTAYSYVNGVRDPGTVILNWNFPGATPTFPNGQGATFSYGAAGSYDLNLTRDGAQYSFPGAASITVKTNPLTVQASVSPNPAYVGDTVTFTCQAFGGSGTGYNYQWSAGLGVFSSNPVTTFRTTTAGSLSATCSVTDSAGGSNSKSITLTTLTGTPSGPACNTNVDFQLRDVNTNQIIARQSNFGIEFYQVSTGQNLQFEPTGTYGSYAWSFGDNGTDSAQVGHHTYAAGGQFTVSLTATPGSGQTLCNTSKTVTFQVTGPTAQFSTAYEDGSTITYSSVTAFKNLVFTAYDSNVSAYSWDFGDSSAHKADAAVTHSFLPGTWTVTLTVTKGSASASTSLALTVVPPPEPPKWVVPGMAYLAGQVPGTSWQSDVTILNPDPSHSAQYSIAFLDGRNPVDDYSKLTWIGPITIDPLKSVFAGNLLADIFKQPIDARAYGALIVRGDLAPLPPVITARTFNNGDAAKGTFGLSVPSSATSGGVASQSSAAASVLIGLKQNDKAYTNLGLVNLKNDWPKVALDFTDSNGTALATKTVDMMPYQSLQIGNVLTDAGYQGSSDLYTIRVRILQGTAVYPFATVIDQGSTDPIVVTPSEAPANTYRLPGIVRLTGANGEAFRSRVTVANPSLNSRKIRVAYSYVACDATGCADRAEIGGNVGFAPGQTQTWDDFVKILFGYFLRVNVADTTAYKDAYLDIRPADGDPNSDPLVVLGETYNDTQTGHVGLQIPGYTPLDGASRAGAYKRLALTGLASTAAYRTNLALFAVAGAPGKWVGVHVYASDGTKLRDIPVLVDGVAQLSNGTLFGGLPGDLSRLSVIIDNVDDGITVGGYATIIDNVSGDSTFVRATPVP